MQYKSSFALCASWSVVGCIPVYFFFLLKNTSISIRGNPQTFLLLHNLGSIQCNDAWVSACCFEARPHLAKRNLLAHSVLFLLFLFCACFENGSSISLVWCLVDTLEVFVKLEGKFQPCCYDIWCVLNHGLIPFMPKNIGHWRHGSLFFVTSFLLHILCKICSFT